MKKVIVIYHLSALGVRDKFLETGEHHYWHRHVVYSTDECYQYFLSKANIRRDVFFGGGDGKTNVMLFWLSDDIKADKILTTDEIYDLSRNQNDITHKATVRRPWRRRFVRAIRAWRLIEQYV